MAAIIRGDAPVVGDYRGFSLKRAQALGVFTSIPSAFEDEFTLKAGTSPSRWKTTLVGTGAVSIRQDIAGGVMRNDTGATAGGTALASVGNGTDTPSMILEPGVSGTRWYLLWVFSVPTAVDNQTSVYIEITRSAGVDANTMFFGVIGPISTTKFLGGDVTAQTLSSISIDTNWHYLEVWQTGTARVLNFAFDGESPKSCTMAGNLGAAARLGINVNNGSTAASRQCDTDHVCMLMPGNVTLPLVSGG